MQFQYHLRLHFHHRYHRHPPPLLVAFTSLQAQHTRFRPRFGHTVWLESQTSPLLRLQFTPGRRTPSLSRFWNQPLLKKFQWMTMTRKMSCFFLMTSKMVILWILHTHLLYGCVPVGFFSVFLLNLVANKR